MPDSSGLKKPIRLIHLSDLHFGTEDEAALAVVERFIAGAKPDALLVSGDITQRGRRREFQAARDWLDRIAVPALVVPGNHDTPIFDMHTRMIAPFGRYRRFIDGHDVVDKLIVLRDGEVRISGINTARGVQARRNWADGVVDMDDLEAALGLLSEGPRDAWRLLLCHHPLIHPLHAQITVQTLRGEEALGRCAEARVDAILTGHIHDAFADPISTERRPVVQMGAGTLSTRLRATRASFCIIEIDGDRMAQDVVTIDRAGLEMRRNYDSSTAVGVGTWVPRAR
jgi:3',5'-cyclic AMP phosphodiesterase CpdA